MTVREFMIGGFLAGATGAGFAGSAALLGVPGDIWMLTALGAAAASLGGWPIAKARFLKRNE